MALTKVTRGGITADAVDGTKIADDAVDSEHYTATSVDNAHINDLAASKLTGALPAISGASLTSLPADSTKLPLAGGTMTGTVTINQDTDSNAILIDSESTSHAVIYVDGGKYGIRINQDITGGYAGYFYRNLNEAGSNPLVEINDTHTSNTQPALKVIQDGAGYGISIDQNGNMPAIYIDHDGVTNRSSLLIDTPSTTTGSVLRVADADSLTTGMGLRIDSNSSDTSTRNLVYIHNDHASATGTTALYVKQDSTGAAARFDGKVGIGKTPGTLFDCYGAGDQYPTFSSTGRCLVKCITNQTASSSYQIGFHMEDASDNQWGMKLMDSSGDLWFIDNSAGHSGRRPLVLTKADGNVKIDGNLVIATSGKGIDFSATADGTTMSSELLDDYEEGTWTPGFQTGTPTYTTVYIREGSYTKIGRLVTVSFSLYVANDIAFVDATAELTIGSLPFTSKASGQGYGYVGACDSFNMAGWSGATYNTGHLTVKSILARIEQNGTNIVFRACDESSSQYHLRNACVDSHGGSLKVTMQYQTD